MKKIFSIAIAALALTACSEMYGPKEDPVPAVQGGSVNITVTEIKDSSITVVFAPESTTTTYYSYLVDEDSQVYDLDPESLYEVGYTSVAQGTVSYKANPTDTLKLKDLDPDSDYVIYAVAGSADGTPGVISTKKVHTSDMVDPEISGVSVVENVVKIAFADGGMQLAEGAEFNVRAYYDENVSDDIYYDTEFATVEQDSIAVAVKGNVATITISGLKPGTYYSVSYAEGTFLDAAGNVCPAQESGYTYNNSGALVKKGICGRLSNESYDFTFYGATDEDDMNPELITNLASYIWLNVPEGFEKGYVDDSKLATVLYEGTNEKHEYQLGYGKDGGFLFAWSIYNCPYVIPYSGYYCSTPAPARGNIVTITLPEAWLVDVYGNTNNEFTVGPFLYSYGYTEDDVFGTYDMAYTSYWGGDYTGSFTFSESDYEPEEDEDDPEYTIAISDGDFGGCPFYYSVYGYVDYDRGTIAIESNQTMYVSRHADTDGNFDGYREYCIYEANGSDYLDFTVPSSGTIVPDSSELMSVVVYKYDTEWNYTGYGWYDIAASMELTKAADEEGESISSTLGEPVAMPKNVKHPTIKPVIK